MSHRGVCMYNYSCMYTRNVVVNLLHTINFGLSTQTSFIYRL